jgi:hypothetical protein
LNGIRAGKYAFKAASILVEVLILVIVAGPVAGAVSPEFMAQHPVGLGIDLQAIQPQLQQVFSSGSTINGTHGISVPVFNNWPLSGTATLTLAIVEGNKTIYQTQPATLQLPPFRSGELVVSFVFSNSLVAQMQGKSLGVGGSESLSEDNYWTITVSLSK